MLVRAYRFTDKLGVALLKSLSAGTDSILNGVTTSLAGSRQLLVGIASVILLVLMFIFSLLKQVAILVGRFLAVVFGVLRVIGERLWAVLKAILGITAGVGFAFGDTAARVTGNRMRRSVGSMPDGTVSGSMARRSSRAEMDVRIREDPLRVQNRMLSALVIVMGIVLVGLILIATDPSRTGAPNVPGGGAPDLGDISVSAAPTTENDAIAFATPIPVASPVPEILQVRGTIAYTLRERGQTDIWAVGVGANSPPIRLTNDPADERDPVWSPNGLMLAYASREGGNWDIYTYDLITGETIRRTFDLSFQAGPQWSPDGQLIVYESYLGDNLEIFITSLDGTIPPTPIAQNPAPDFSPAWSSAAAGGRHIAFVSLRDGNKDIYVFSLDSGETYNLTNTPNRDEDHPAFSPDGNLIAYSAVENGIETVYVRAWENDPSSVAQALNVGRAPSWAPDGQSVVFATDTSDSTQLFAGPIVEGEVATRVITVPSGATDPTWTDQPLPVALVNSGGLGPAVSEALYDVPAPAAVGLPYRMYNLADVRTTNPFLSDAVGLSFDGLREATIQAVGWDFIGELEDAFWPLDRPIQPGEERRNWHMTGRAFAIRRDSIRGIPPDIEVVREDDGRGNTYWRVFVRVAEEAQSGQLGEPLRVIPWDFLARDSGDVEAYNNGGRLRPEVPSGYYVDFTLLAEDYGWSRIPAGSDWLNNVNVLNYWEFQKRDGLVWIEAMYEIYTPDELGGFNPTPTPAPAES